MTWLTVYPNVVANDNRKYESGFEVAVLLSLIKWVPNVQPLELSLKISYNLLHVDLFLYCKLLKKKDVAKKN